MLLKDYLAESKIVRDTGFSDRLAEYADKFLIDDQLFEEFFKKRIYTVGDEPETTYRSITHWLELGLINDHRENGKGWHRFSVRDMIWQHVIISLRFFGVQNAKILLSKQYFDNVVVDKKSEITLFDYYLHRAFFLKRPVSIIVFANGWVDFADNIDLPATEHYKALPIHLRLSLNSILMILFKDDFYTATKFGLVIDDDGQPLLIGDGDKRVLRSLRDTSVREITVKLSNGQVKAIELKQDEDPAMRIIDVAKKGGFMDISIKTENGKIVSVVSKNKLRIK